jgi:DinB superfamily
MVRREKTMEQSTLTVTAPAVGVASQEREHAARYLAATRDRLVEALQGLSEAQWNFKPSPDRWSIAENMDHMAVVEERLLEIVGNIGQGPADARDRDVKQVDAFILVAVPMRHPKYKAPERVAPIGNRSGAEALAHFLKSRARTAELLASASPLRGHVMPHPIFGPWDGYEWILAAAGHSARHTGQILEVKGDPNFPAA